MGFERQFGAREVCEWVRESRVSSVWAAVKSCKSVGVRSGDRSLTVDEHTDATSCLRTSKIRN